MEDPLGEDIEITTCLIWLRLQTPSPEINYNHTLGELLQVISREADNMEHQRISIDLFT